MYQTMYKYVETQLDYLAARAGIDWRDDRGLTTTEIAIMTFLLASIAVGVGAILWTAARGQANNIPTTTANPTG